jgi:AraC-like DNA-binding protein
MSTASQLQVSVGLTRAILEALRMLAVPDPEGLLPLAGIDPALLDKPENRIPFEQQQSLWTLAVERAGGAAFGLHFARCIQPMSFGLLGYMVMNCATIAECLEATVKYQFLAGQGGEFSLVHGGKETSAHACLCYSPVNPEHPVTQHRVVAMLAANVSFGRWLIGEAFGPEKVEFTHAAPGNAGEYEEFFGCAVVFGASCNCLHYSADVMALAVPNASEDLLQLLGDRADRQLGNLSQSSPIAARIATLIATQLDNTVPDRSLIAAQLGMSQRTLQRRLRDEGTSYQAVLDNTRHYMAVELLRNTQIPLSRVAGQLGFAEPSAFYRAFKKWEGVTPGQYRESAVTV